MRICNDTLHATCALSSPDAVASCRSNGRMRLGNVPAHNMWNPVQTIVRGGWVHPPTPNDTNAYHTHHCCNTIQTHNTHNHIARWLEKSVYTLYGWTCHPLAVQNTHSHYGNTRQGNARQHNTRQRKATQCNARHGTQSCRSHRTRGRNACRQETWPDASRLRPRRRGHGRTSYPHKLTGYWGPHKPKPNDPIYNTTLTYKQHAHTLMHQDIQSDGPTERPRKRQPEIHTHLPNAPMHGHSTHAPPVKISRPTRHTTQLVTLGRVHE
jgi:hypothetical protein